MDSQGTDSLSPGSTIEVRDELWVITQVTRTSDGWRLAVRGLSEFVRDKPAVFFTALENSIVVFDPADVTVVADNSPRLRHSKLWLESRLRSTPVPLYQERLEVAGGMLVDPLDYQLTAVRSALSPRRTRPRILLADAVGLGKTLEIGMIIAELIRRGRGERILVVTPNQVLEQFQQELWSRFTIPLVRLDSLGLQRVRQKLPASKNPFSFYPRAIISMDTLKLAKYRAHLEQVSWDVVVIDEVHNATNAGSLNNQLARVLAPKTDALILASATPHNGREESFRELIRLLDPLAVNPDGTIDQAAARELIIRRHRNSPEVAAVVGANWAKRKDPLNLVVSPSAEELAVAEELNRVWLDPQAAPVADRLFPWTLVKAFLSSPAALGETLSARLDREEKRLAGAEAAQNQNAVAALGRLAELNEKVTAATSAKFQRLVAYLREIGVAKESPTRVVVFSERVATLYWLHHNLVEALGMPAGAVRVMHGGLSDVEQLALIDEFKREKTPLRILVTGDVASEGVNLHTQCHHLVHFDIPWSLIRIQQRNGRVDRYGQKTPPQITTLLLDCAAAGEMTGELHVLTRLVEREAQANELLGDASSLMGKHSVSAEEDEIRKVLAGAKTFDAAVSSPGEVLTRAGHLGVEGEVGEPGGNAGAAAAFDADAFLASLGASVPGRSSAGDAHAAVSTAEAGSFSGATGLRAGLPDAAGAADTAGVTGTAGIELDRTAARSLYPTELDYLEDALDEAFLSVPFDTPAAGGVNFRVYRDEDIAELTPPGDLRRRLEFLPQDYVEYRQVMEKLMLATSTAAGRAQLRAAREGDSEKSWPKAHFLGPLHPVTQWAAERALSKMGFKEIPAFLAGPYGPDSPTVVVLGTLTNRFGQVVNRSFFTAAPSVLVADVTQADFRMPGTVSAAAVPDPVAFLVRAGLDPQAISPGNVRVPGYVAGLLAGAVDEAHAQMDLVREEAQRQAQARSNAWRARAEGWLAAAHQPAGGFPGGRFPGGKRAARLLDQEERLMDATFPERSLVRPLAVILPRQITKEGE